MSGGEIEAALDSAWRDYATNMEASRAQAAQTMRDGKPAFGSRGAVSMVAPATKAGEAAAASSVPGYQKDFEALQAKYPGYAQVGNRALGPQAGTSKEISSWVMDPKSVIYDPDFGFLAPTQHFGQGGKKGETYLQRGGMQAIAVMAPVLAGIGYGAIAGSAASSGAAAASAAPNAMQAGAMPGVLGSAGSAAEAAIPGTAAFNATMGGGIGYGLPASTATLGEVGGGLISAAGGAQSGGGLINNAWQWAKDHPMTTARTASNLLGGGGEQAPAQTMELTDWMAQNKVSPQQFANINLGIRPSGATLVNNSGQPVYDTPPRGIINGRL